MNSNRKFWPLDDNSEGEIYENLAWDLPGFRGRKSRPQDQAAGKSRQKTS
jgi:hypothetical protein